jgi:hypothetical protein
MAFSDWEFNKFDGAEVVVIDTVTPINGAGSLQILGTGTSDQGYVSMNLTSTADPSRGRTMAKIQTIFQRNQPSGGGFDHGAGIYFMPSSVTPWVGGASCYWAGMSNDGSTTRWTVIKFTNGIDAWEASTGAGVLATSLTNVTADGANTALEVEWNDAPEFGGVRIVLRAATSGDTDFGNMTDLITITDTSTPLTNSGIAEGFLIADVQGVGGSSQVKPKFDDTSVFSLVAA